MQTTSAVALGTSPSATESLVTALLRFSRLARSWEALEGAGMSKVQVALLMELSRVGTERVTTLSKLLGVEVSVISRQLSAMVDSGAVERVRDPEDGRAWQVTLSEQGRRQLAELHERRNAWFSRILVGFDDTERAAAARVIEAVNAEWESVQRRHS